MLINLFMFVGIVMLSGLFLSQLFALWSLRLMSQSLDALTAAITQAVDILNGLQAELAAAEAKGAAGGTPDASLDSLTATLTAAITAAQPPPAA